MGEMNNECILWFKYANTQQETIIWSDLHFLLSGFLNRLRTVYKKARYAHSTAYLLILLSVSLIIKKFTNNS